jgi:hypothetical protein
MTPSLKDDRHDARAGGAAVLHARDHLLADIAALPEGDAAELVEQRLVREGVAIEEVAPAIGDAEPDAAGVVVVHRMHR